MRFSIKKLFHNHSDTESKMMQITNINKQSTAQSTKQSTSSEKKVQLTALLLTLLYFILGKLRKMALSVRTYLETTQAYQYMRATSTKQLFLLALFCLFIGIYVMRPLYLFYTTQCLLLHNWRVCLL
jgi:hypothetical protein